MARLPSVGLGTYRLKADECRKAVYTALQLGYRLIDTASVYRNEREVGEAVKAYIKEDGGSRDSIFVTSKLSPKDQGYQKAYDAFMRSFAELQLDYIDCFLIHWPGSSGRKPEDPINAELRKESWKALEQVQREGKCKMIGVSNYTLKHMQELLHYANIKPAVLQVEFHPLFYQKELLQFCNDHDIMLQAYASFGEGAFFDESFEVNHLKDIALKHNVTVGQVLLKWALQHNVGVIPKTSNNDRMKENLNLTHFTLDQEDMELLDTQSKQHKFCWDPDTVA